MTTFNHHRSHSSHGSRRFSCGLITGLLLSLLPLSASAQAPDDSLQPRQREYAHMFAVGYTDILDTYLSPEKYKGTELRYVSHYTRYFGSGRLAQTMIHQGSVASTDNRADTGSELAGSYNFQYILRYNWQLTPALRVAVGGAADVNLGFLYNTRNGNNPAQVRASVNLAPSAALRYDFGGKRWAFRLGYEAMAPAVGVMFSPNYGQSYYEIFDEGDKDHNIVVTTTATTPSLRQLLTFDMRPRRKWRRTWLRFGYYGDYQQAQVNHLKYHQYSHLFVLGYVKGL